MNNLQRMRLIELMDKYPQIEARMQAIFDLTENTSGKFDRADDTEEQVIIEVRTLGREILQCWAETAAQKKTEEMSQAYHVTNHSKKNSTGRQHTEQ